MIKFLHRIYKAEELPDLSSLRSIQVLHKNFRGVQLIEAERLVQPMGISHACPLKPYFGFRPRANPRNSAAITAVRAPGALEIWLNWPRLVLKWSRMGISGAQHPASDVLQVFVGEHRLEQAPPGPHALLPHALLPRRRIILIF
jgi:hypothetical protein